MSRMMRSHADTLDNRNERVVSDAGILGDHLFQDVGDGMLTRRRENNLAMVEGLHRFVARAARREENDGRGQVLVVKSDNEINWMNRGRHAVSFPLLSRLSQIRRR